MTIDGREELENAENSILRNNESDLIETDERDLQKLKQEEPIFSIVRGMTMDEGEEPKNALDRIARTKRCAPIQIITRRGWTGPFDSDANPAAIAPLPSTINATPSNTIAG
jgi:methylase of polypeptide subunit release factors